MAEVVALSSVLESRLSALLSLLSGGNPETTMAMFLAVNSADAQRSMLKAAATSVLKGQELETFNDLMDEFRTRYRERNKIVHGIWVVSNDYPDALLLAHSSDMAAMWKRLAIRAVAAIQPDDHLFDGLWQNLMIYKANDFTQIAQRLAAFDGQIMSFWTSILDHQIERVRLQGAPQGELALVPSDQAPPPQEG